MREKYSSLRRSAAAGVLVMTVVGCGTASDLAVQGSTTQDAATPIHAATASTAATPVARATGTPTPVATAIASPTAPAVEATPTAMMGATVSGSVVALRDVRDLTWSSSMIVHGKVAQILPAQRFPAENGPLGPDTPQSYYDAQIYTDYVVDVDQVFRGAKTETVTVRQMGGEVDGFRLDTEDYPHLRVGDDLVLFLMPPVESQPGDAHWVTGASQGYWLANGGQFAPFHGQFSPLDLAGMGQAVADALRQGPPENLPLDLVSLDQSPPGPDLPAAATPVP